MGLRTHPRYDFYINGRQVLMENRHCAHITLDFAYFEMPYELAVVEDVKSLNPRKADSRDYPLRKAIFQGSVSPYRTEGDLMTPWPSWYHPEYRKPAEIGKIISCARNTSTCPSKPSQGVLKARRRMAPPACLSNG